MFELHTVRLGYILWTEFGTRLGTHLSVMVYVNAFAVALGTIKTPSTQYITIGCLEVYSGGGGDRHREAVLKIERSTAPDFPDLCKTLGTMARNYKRTTLKHFYGHQGIDEDDEEAREDHLRSLLNGKFSSVVESVKAIASGEIVESVSPDTDAFAIAVPIKKNHFGTNNMNIAKWLGKVKDDLEEIDPHVEEDDEDEDDE